MFKHIEIAHFRSCHGVVLDDLGPLTVLVGRNAAGKTNILRAIRWLATSATSTPAFAGPYESGHLSVQAVVGITTYHYTVRFAVASSQDAAQPVPPRQPRIIESLQYEDGHGTRHLIFERRDEEVRLSQSDTPVAHIGTSVPCMPALVAFLPAGSRTVNLIRPFLSFLGRTRYYSLDTDEPCRPFLIDQTAYDEWLTRYPGTGYLGTSVLMRLLHMRLTNDPRFDEIRSLLGPDGLELVDDISLDSFEAAAQSKPEQGKEAPNKFYWLSFRPSLQPSASSRYFDFADLSTGTQRVIRILVSLIFDESAVMLLEHPEDGIHRGLLRKLIDLLQKYSDQSQLIVSSHSPLVFNTLDPRAVRLVTMEEGATKVRRLTPEELQVAGKFLEEDGSLADFLETVQED